MNTYLNPNINPCEKNNKMDNRMHILVKLEWLTIEFPCNPNECHKIYYKHKTLILELNTLGKKYELPFIQDDLIYMSIFVNKIKRRLGIK